MPRTYDLPLPDLTGRRALVTGASDGMGLVIAERLAGAGAEVLLPVRNRAKGEAAVTRIRGTHPQARLVLHDLDLASLESVNTLTARLREDGEPLHLLVNNAGLMTPPERQVTQDGFELQLGTNHLGHWALTAGLLPVLRAGGARVVNQGSVAARRATINWDDLNFERDYDGMAAYRQSKLACVLFGLELSRRSAAAGWGVTSAVAHPGVAPTSLLAARPELGREGDSREVRMIRWLSRRGILAGTVESAGLPALMAATADDADGRFYGPQGLGGTSGRPGETALWKPMRDEAAAARLWTTSAELTGVDFG
jgi:NAD(P)-dependent dehydrogenase (short-subunit alcohol dehydrogenase family)